MQPKGPKPYIHSITPGAISFVCGLNLYTNFPEKKIVH